MKGGIGGEGGHGCGADDEGTRRGREQLVEGPKPQVSLHQQKILFSCNKRILQTGLI